MITGRLKAAVNLTDAERLQLESISHSRTLPHALVTRALIVLRAAEGASNIAIANEAGLSVNTVCKWRHRYVKEGIPGLYDKLRPGRPRSVSHEKVAAVIRKTLKTKPKDGTRWTIRSIAEEIKLSRPTVHRIWTAFGLQPHRQH